MNIILSNVPTIWMKYCYKVDLSYVVDEHYFIQCAYNLYEILL